jgi:hypothetical protein
MSSVKARVVIGVDPHKASDPSHPPTPARPCQQSWPIHPQPASTQPDGRRNSTPTSASPSRSRPDRLEGFTPAQPRSLLTTTPMRVEGIEEAVPADAYVDLRAVGFDLTRLHTGREGVDAILKCVVVHRFTPGLDHVRAGPAASARWSSHLGRSSACHEDGHVRMGWCVLLPTSRWT